MSTSDSGWPVRRPMRLSAYDYRTYGDYFVTICIQDKRCLLGSVVSGEMALSPAGRLVEREWLRLPERHPGVELDEHIVMPNHLHGIVSLRTRQPLVGASLGMVIGAFKSITTLRYGDGVRAHGWPAFSGRLWQRGFHERVIRNDDELDAIRTYIRQNPANWERDRFHRRDRS